MIVRQSRLIVLPWVQSFNVELHPGVRLILFVLCNLAWSIFGCFAEQRSKEILSSLAVVSESLQFLAHGDLSCHMILFFPFSPAQMQEECVELATQDIDGYWHRELLQTL
jgi:hypothetical protein